MSEATGQFEVEVTPQTGPDAAVGRFALAKRFHGGLDGTSTGEMLEVRTKTDGSAGYVAMEAFAGTLDGKAGGFVLQHSGTMRGGQSAMRVTVVPDSGTGALTGIAGEMTIAVAQGRHDYSFRYTLPAP